MVGEWSLARRRRSAYVKERPPNTDPLALITLQKDLCAKHGVAWFEAPDNMKVGIARNVRSDLKPLNGLRHPPIGDTTGWYLWAGEETSDDPDFFEPIHVSHLSEICPAALKFLGLPPGWRFLTGENHEDVWADPRLLNV